LYEKDKINKKSDSCHQTFKKKNMAFCAGPGTPLPPLFQASPGTPLSSPSIIGI
jgi:hypothetical protein